MIDFSGSSNQARLYIELPDSIVILSLNEEQKLRFPAGKSIAYGSKVQELGIKYDKATRILTIPKGYFAIAITHSKNGKGYVIKRIDTEMTAKLRRNKNAAQSSINESMDKILKKIVKFEAKLGPRYQSAKSANTKAAKENMAFAGTMLTELSRYVISGELAKYIKSLADEDDQKEQK